MIGGVMVRSIDIVARFLSSALNAAVIAGSVLVLNAGAVFPQPQPRSGETGPANLAAQLPGYQIAPGQPTDYRLGSGDRVRITVVGEQDLTGEYLVDSTGMIAFPLVGRIHAGGLTASELEKEIVSKLRPDYLTDPKVSAAVLTYRPFYMVGEVKNPGTFPRDIKPGVERWPVKTDAPTTTTAKKVPLETLLALKDVSGVSKNDPRYQSARIPTSIDGFHEGELISTRGWLHLVAGESDGDYHIQISASATSGDNCLIVAVPNDDPAFTANPQVLAAAKTVRAWLREKVLKDRDPSENGSVMQHPVYVEVVGALFYDDARVGDKPRGKREMKAATLFELHPVMAIQFAPKP